MHAVSCLIVIVIGFVVVAEKHHSGSVAALIYKPVFAEGSALLKDRVTLGI